MLIRFWGVRGSIPTCITPQQIQKKISAVVQRITPSDIESADAREKFLARLPDWLYGCVGGNTPCIQLITNSDKHFILDAGTGLRAMCKDTTLPKNMHYNMFFSHFHWDHLQGIPFFDPIYNSNVSFDIYSTFPNAKKLLSDQMESPYFPVHWDILSKNINFHRIKRGEPFVVDGIPVVCCKMEHPGNSYSYAFVENGKKFVYATDIGLSIESFDFSEEKKSVFENADILVFDSQYSVEEAVIKSKWGHSAFCTAIDFAVHWHVKKLYLFHHEPTNDDRKLSSILSKARWYVDYIASEKIEVYLATEGLEIKL